MLREFFHRLGALVRRARLDQELDEEMRFHLARETEQNMRRGMNEREARRAAERSFGNQVLAKERTRQARSFTSCESVYRDLLLSLRKLKSEPAFTLLVTATLAVAVGANTAVFTVIDGVILRPLAYPHPEQLVMVWQHDARKQEIEGRTSFANFADWRERNRSFAAMAALIGNNFERRPQAGESPDEPRGQVVTADFFQVMGVSPMLGRGFDSTDEEAGRGDVAVISHALWQQRFGADARAVGKQVRLGGENMTVVGVMPAGFEFPEGARYWRPLTLSAAMKSKFRATVFLTVVGRLKDGVQIGQAQDEMNNIAAGLRELYPRENEGVGIRLVALSEQTVRDVRIPLFILWAAVASLLLISCVNVANLMLGRSVARQREIAVRLALGAGRARVLRLLFLEGLLLSFLGAAGGLVLARWALDVFMQGRPSFLPRTGEVGLDARVLAFTVVLSVVTTLIFCLTPALSTLKVDVNKALKAGAQSVAGGHGAGLRQGLVVAQIALTFALLISAGLLVKSFWRLRHVDLGFAPENLLTVRVRVPEAKYKFGPPLNNFYASAEERLRGLPGVAEVGSSTSMLLSELEKIPILVEGGAERLSEGTDLPVNQVSPGFFSTMRTPLVGGRDFTRQEVETEALVAILSESAARRFWPGQEALGRKFKPHDPGFPNDTWLTVIGIVRDARRRGPDQPGGIEGYLPGYAHVMDIAVRTRHGDPASLGDALRREIKALDSDVRIESVRTVDERLGEMIELQRYTVLVTGAFAAAALLLALIGLYGVMSYLVTQRTKEIGIRIALGARGADVLRMVLLKGLWPAAVGMACGLLGAVASARLMQSVLFATSATDVATYLVIALAFMATACAACLVPAWRANKIDPLVALRDE